ncbi:MAG: alkaline phosphatase family protein [Nitrososphaeraceae archaeon]
MTLIVKPLVRKLPILLGFIFVLLFTTSIKDDFIGHIGKAEVNLTNITMNNSGLSGSNTTQINMNTPLNNSIKHVVIIVMENKGYKQVIGSADAPYQNQLAKNYASASKYYGVYPDSLPNYISIISGYPYLTEDKEPNTMSPLKEHTIVNLLQSKNLSWKGYFEDMPRVCHLKDSGGSGYIAHHNPFVYFDLRNDDSCKNTVGLDEFYKDLSNQTLPNYSFIVPNNIHNTHDSTVTEGDHWLSEFVPKIINSVTFNNTALFIVYDEGKKHDESGFGSGTYAVNGGRLPLLLVSPFANKGFVSSHEYTHYNLLTTVEKILNLGNLGKGDATAKPMKDLFRTLS